MNVKAYSSQSLKQRCDKLIDRITQDIIEEIRAKNGFLSYEEAYLLFIRSMDTQKVQQCITENARCIKNDFKNVLVN